MRNRRINPDQQHEREHAEPPQPQAGPAGSDGEELEVSESTAHLVQQLQAERDEAIEARLRALADFRNFQRRAMENEQRAYSSGAQRITRALIPVLDHFDVTLSQEPQQLTTQQLLDAVNMISHELRKALTTQGIERIEPVRGEAFDPNRHEAVMRQPADDLPPGVIVQTLQPGYSMADGSAVLRPAKVAISPSSEE